MLASQVCGARSMASGGSQLICTFGLTSFWINWAKAPAPGALICASDMTQAEQMTGRVQEIASDLCDRV